MLPDWSFAIASSSFWNVVISTLVLYCFSNFLTVSGSM
jgi:hypothetical protein